MRKLSFSLFSRLVCLFLFLATVQGTMAQSRRPIDSKHPLWLVHIDVWNKADPQKIIDLIPADVRPYVCMNLSLSCQYDTEKNVYKMPQNAVRTYKSWATVCQANGLWFTCQPASGGHTHIQDDDLETFEYFYQHYPNFLGWNYAEQFWGFDEPNDKSSSTQSSRIALFAKLVPMAHKYGGFLTVSFCGNIWSHPLNPIGMMKRNNDLLNACQQYPEAILWLYKYTTSSCFYNNESVTFGPFISGLANNYGVRYDNCGWNGALGALLGENHGKKYPIAAGIGTVMEQSCVNGGAVWDGPELIWTEDFQNLSNTQSGGYAVRQWGTFPGFPNAWIDMFQKITDGSLYIPTREEVVEKTKIVVINDVAQGNDEQKYAAWGDLYDGLYKQTDPFNRNNGQWMDNFCYFKKTGRYGAIPITTGLYDDAAKAIPVQVKKSVYTSRWSTQARKQQDFNKQYPVVSTGDLYVNRYRNQLITYTPYTYLNSKRTATATIPLAYNTCENLKLTYDLLSSGAIREYADHIDFYLNNFRTDTTTLRTDQICITGATSEPAYTLETRKQAQAEANSEWDAETGTYTLNVCHMGPVDLRISCSGTATDRATDYLSAEPLSLDLPLQPEPYHGEIIIEAEDMDYKNIRSCVTDPYTWYPSVRGHAGNGFVDMGTNTAAALRHNLNLKEGGTYNIYFRYTSPQKAGTTVATVNSSRKAVRINKTNENQWVKAKLTVALKAGQNTLVFTNTGGTGFYLDNVTYAPADLPEETFNITFRPAAHGTVSADYTEATEGTTVHLTAEPEPGYALVGWNILHGDVVLNADDSFQMPDDNVTLQPIFQDQTLAYSLDFTDVLAGTMPEGWKVTQDNGEVHQYPSSYTSGSRTFSGFSGYQGKALYWRVGKAEYGNQAGYPLHLAPGCYILSYANAGWKATPNYKVEVLGANDAVIATSGTQQAAPNANGNSAANLSSAVLRELPFTVEEEGNYVIRFSNLGSGFDEFLLLACNINIDIIATDIATTPNEEAASVVAIYNLAGVKIPTLQRGYNLVEYSNGITRKVFIK